MEHAVHELWHEVVPVLGGAIALVIAGLVLRRKRNGKK